MSRAAMGGIRITRIHTPRIVREPHKPTNQHVGPSFPSRKRQPHTNPVNPASSITYCGSGPHSVRANPQQGLDEP